MTPFVRRGDIIKLWQNFWRSSSLMT
jgi:hypothetical protein